MINIFVSNFWYCNKIIHLTKHWLLCTLYNLNTNDLNLLRIMLKDLYSSKLHILKNKYLKQSYLKLDIYNKSVVITSFDKNLYFFRTELFEFLDTLYNTNKHNFNILALFSNSRIIDISTFYRYKKNNIITFFNFFKKISSINLKTVYNKNIFVLLFSNILILDYYILFNVNFLLNWNFFIKNNIF